MLNNRNMTWNLVTQKNEWRDWLLGGKFSDGAGMFIAMSLFHFSIFGSTSFSQFSIFGRSSPVTTADDDTAVTVMDDSSSLPWAEPRACFLSRRPFNLGGSLPLLLRFCSDWRADAYDRTPIILNKKLSYRWNERSLGSSEIKRFTRIRPTNSNN